MRPGGVWDCGRVTAGRVGEREAPHWVASLWTPPSWETGEPGPQWTNLVLRGWLRSTDGLSLAREGPGVWSCGQDNSSNPQGGGSEEEPDA